MISRIPPDNFPKAFQLLFPGFLMENLSELLNSDRIHLKFFASFLQSPSRITFPRNFRGLIFRVYLGIISEVSPKIFLWYFHEIYFRASPENSLKFQRSSLDCFQVFSQKFSRDFSQLFLWNLLKLITGLQTEVLYGLSAGVTPEIPSRRFPSVAVRASLVI